eukprot:9213804-Karenia_brevis.AAC.1
MPTFIHKDSWDTVVSKDAIRALKTPCLKIKEACPFRASCIRIKITKREADRVYLSHEDLN